MSVSAGFSFNIPPFTANLFGGSISTQNSTESSFNPKFTVHPFTLSPKLGNDAYFITGISLIPKIVLNMSLFNEFQTHLGIGMKNALASKLTNGFYAQPICKPEETKLVVDGISNLLGFIDLKTASMKPWYGKNLINMCV